MEHVIAYERIVATAAQDLDIVYIVVPSHQQLEWLIPSLSKASENRAIGSSFCQDRCSLSFALHRSMIAVKPDPHSLFRNKEALCFDSFSQLAATQRWIFRKQAPKIVAVLFGVLERWKIARASFDDTLWNNSSGSIQPRPHSILFARNGMLLDKLLTQ